MAKAFPNNKLNGLAPARTWFRQFPEPVLVARPPTPWSVPNPDCRTERVSSPNLKRLLCRRSPVIAGASPGMFSDTRVLSMHACMRLDDQSIIPKPDMRYGID